MQVLQINKFYPFILPDSINKTSKYLYLLGGIETLMLSIKTVLEKHGHKSVFFAMQHPENLTCETSDYFVPYIDMSIVDGFVNKMRAAGRILYSFDARRRLSKLLDAYEVEIIHIHNIYHHISPSILHEIKKRGIPVVMTLHDYKMVCASYSMLFGNKPCEACSGGKYYNALLKKCVKDSWFKSMLAAAEMYFHHKILNIYDTVDIFISPSLFLKNKLEETGFKKNIIHLPNFINLQKFKFDNRMSHPDDKKSIVYFGRLSHEKGLWTLLEASRSLKHDNIGRNIEIKIIGDGPIRDELKELVKADGINNVRFLGYLQGKELYQEINKSSVVVLTTECYENNPVSVLEAFALSKPVVGARIGGIPELVKDGETGITFEPGNPNDLSSKILHMINNPVKADEMGKNARELVELEFNAEKYYEKSIEIYKQLIYKYSTGNGGKK
jgi:glycosyltransferase involved in cell wall biosynthesis